MGDWLYLQQPDRTWEKLQWLGCDGDEDTTFLLREIVGSALVVELVALLRRDDCGWPVDLCSGLLDQLRALPLAARTRADSDGEWERALSRAVETGGRLVMDPVGVPGSQPFAIRLRLPKA